MKKQINAGLDEVVEAIIKEQHPYTSFDKIPFKDNVVVNIQAVRTVLERFVVKGNEVTKDQIIATLHKTANMTRANEGVLVKREFSDEADAILKLFTTLTEKGFDNEA